MPVMDLRTQPAIERVVQSSIAQHPRIRVCGVNLARLVATQARPIHLEVVRCSGQLYEVCMLANLGSLVLLRQNRFRWAGHEMQQTLP